MTPLLVPLTKDQWVLGLSDYYPTPRLDVEIWEAVFDKLVRYNVFQAHWSGNGKYNLIVSLEELDLRGVIEKIREELAVKAIEGLRLD
jgi:hypothetical protein